MSSGVVSQRTSTHVLPGPPALLGEVGVEHDRAGGSSRRRVQTGCDDVDVGAGVDHRVEQLVELSRVDPRDGLLARDEILRRHLDGDAERRLRRPLSRPRLEQVERAVLDRELDVLHLAVVLLHALERLAQLRVGGGQDLAHPLDRLRRADAGNDVLALRVRAGTRRTGAAHRSRGRA